MRFGAATFADVARATRGFDERGDSRAQVDVGAGLRIRVPGARGIVRADFATGLRDGARAISVQWQR
jgi:outer membrane translocation and assembly module TamA